MGAYDLEAAGRNLRDGDYAAALDQVVGEFDVTGSGESRGGGRATGRGRRRSSRSGLHGSPSSGGAHGDPGRGKRTAARRSRVGGA